MKNKIDKGSILFILYALWHAVIIDALIESSASVIVRLISMIGIVAVDIYLFFTHYQRGS